MITIHIGTWASSVTKMCIREQQVFTVSEVRDLAQEVTSREGQMTTVI